MPEYLFQIADCRFQIAKLSSLLNFNLKSKICNLKSSSFTTLIRMKSPFWDSNPRNNL